MGIVTEIGNEVQKFKVGDKVGVGCVVGGCDTCHQCTNDLENYCDKTILTYNYIYHDGTRTYGGFSDEIVVEEHYVLRFPDRLPMDGAAPLFCAGITVYSPLKYYGLDKPGLHIGVVGLGGLGHLAVKFAKALGVRVTVISTSPRKQKEAIDSLGADAFLVSTDELQMKVCVYIWCKFVLIWLFDFVNVDEFLGCNGEHGWNNRYSVSNTCIDAID